MKTALIVFLATIYQCGPTDFTDQPCQNGRVITYDIPTPSTSAPSTSAPSTSAPSTSAYYSRIARQRRAISQQQHEARQTRVREEARTQRHTNFLNTLKELNK